VTRAVKQRGGPGHRKVQHNRRRTEVKKGAALGSCTLKNERKRANARRFDEPFVPLVPWAITIAIS
jgi:hypothetical protein